jgi:hypothetical protein
MGWSKLQSDLGIEMDGTKDSTLAHSESLEARTMNIVKVAPELHFTLGIAMDLVRSADAARRQLTLN